VESGEEDIIDADPTVYDNFNNSAYDGKINESLWNFYMDNRTGQIYQKDGVLVLSLDEIPSWSEDYYVGIGLSSRMYNYIIANPTFFESKFKLDSPQTGAVYLNIVFDSTPVLGDVSGCTFGFGDKQAAFICGFFGERSSFYNTQQVLVDYGTWHTARIEVDPATMKFTYYFDGEFVDSYIPANAEELKKAEAHFDVGIGSQYTEASIGYIDDVRIGQIEQ